MANKVVTVHVEGLDALEAKLYDLPTKFAKRVMRRALRAGAQIWKDAIDQAAEKFTKYATGWMRSQSAIATRLSAKEDSGSALVGFRKKQNPARLGHAKHVPSAANEARWKEMGTSKQAASPFIRPAFEANAARVLDKFTEVAKEELENVFPQHS